MTEEGKRKIGEKNSLHMKQYMANNPDVARDRARRMSLAGTNEATNLKRSLSVNRFWSSDSDATKQRRKEASDRAIRLLSENKIGPQAPFKTCYVQNTFTGKDEYMHSSWETAFLSACIKADYPVTKDHSIRIPYVAHDGTDHVYVPDFVSLGGDNQLFEIKGLVRENDDLKLKACEAWCAANGYELVVISSV